MKCKNCKKCDKILKRGQYKFCSRRCSALFRCNDPVWLEKLRTAHSGKGFSIYTREKMKESSLKFRLNNPTFCKNENHYLAKNFILRDPTGKIWRFKNLKNFIRQNPNLFNKEDVIWTNTRRETCRAYAGIILINVAGRGSWKGWTKHSQTEELENNGNDLLGRDKSKIPIDN